MRTTAIEWEISNQYMRTVTLVIKSLSLSTDLKDTALKLDVAKNVLQFVLETAHQ